MSVAQSPREVALEVLLAVAEADAYANLLLPKRIAAAGLHGADAAFATQLTYGTLRGLGLYDWIIEQVSGRSLRKIDPVVLAALRLGVHQLLDTRVAKHAAVNETVRLVCQRTNRGAAGFANANLRRIAQHDREGWLSRVSAAVVQRDKQLAIVHSHPQWIVSALADALAREGRGDELSALLRADNVAPLVQLVALPGKAARDELVDAHLRAHLAAPTALELHGGDPGELPAVREQLVRVQDAGSQLAALVLSRSVPLVGGERVLDLCAGPGGKSALLAAETLLAGAVFSANEVSAARAGLVRQALEPLGEFVVTEFDGRDYAARSGQFDRILVDAPCSGLGALRRRPEARWRKSESDVRELVALQRQLLAAALTAVRPGGLVAYVTCSPHLVETTEVVQDAVARGAAEVLDTRVVCHRLAPELDLAEIRLGGGTVVQLWPHRHGTDAMFIALLQTPSAKESADV